jgi:hypothetical protein
MAGTKPHAWETGRMNSITYVGLDVHKATVSVAVAESGRGGEIRQLGVFENRPEVLSKLAARLSNMSRGLHQLRSLFAGLVDGAARFGLDGEASGTVSTVQAARAEAQRGPG